MNDLTDIRTFLRSALTTTDNALVLRNEKTGQFEVAGTKEVMQGKQRVDGHYFASVIDKPKDIRLYFFPIYTHASEFSISEGLQKKLKGKSCFHIKAIDENEQKEIKEMIDLGAELYKRDGLI